MRIRLESGLELRRRSRLKLFNVKKLESLLGTLLPVVVQGFVEESPWKVKLFTTEEAMKGISVEMSGRFDDGVGGNDVAVLEVVVPSREKWKLTFELGEFDRICRVPRGERLRSRGDVLAIVWARERPRGELGEIITGGGGGGLFDSDGRLLLRLGCAEEQILGESTSNGVSFRSAGTGGIESTIGCCCCCGC